MILLHTHYVEVLQGGTCQDYRGPCATAFLIETCNTSKRGQAATRAINSCEHFHLHFSVLGEGCLCKMHINVNRMEIKRGKTFCVKFAAQCYKWKQLPCVVVGAR